jgi:hypothetical protein
MPRLSHHILLGLVGVGIMVCAPRAEQWANDKESAYTWNSQQIQIGLALAPVGLVAAYEYGFHEAISGGIATGVMTDPNVYIPLIFRAAFHPFNLQSIHDRIAIRDKLDVFAGLAMGFEIGSDAPQHFMFREYLGVKFFFDSKFGVFVEDCGGLGFLTLGLTMKF